MHLQSIEEAIEGVENALEKNPTGPAGRRLRMVWTVLDQLATAAVAARRRTWQKRCELIQAADQNNVNDNVHIPTPEG